MHNRQILKEDIHEKIYLLSAQPDPIHTNEAHTQTHETYSQKKDGFSYHCLDANVGAVFFQSGHNPQQAISSKKKTGDTSLFNYSGSPLFSFQLTSLNTIKEDSKNKLSLSRAKLHFFQAYKKACGIELLSELRASQFLY